MLKIDKTTGVQATVKTDKNDNNGEIKGKNFGSTLKALEEGSVEAKLKILLNKIKEQGTKLSQRLDIKDLKDYKNLVTEFMTEAVTNTFKFSKESYLDRRGRHRVHIIVKKVNDKLDEITQQVLSEERDRLAITASIEDIRGMLIDLFM